eukprot:TRINITY_DN28638_c0_g1_i1.p1 TRINITY_DN28638_c0_g1~~TRINITY_DN28638_c0_g1_i1.p1  ORF type:complete len:498 (-),score=113.68 TRINITY_DN28638_c0_g1_i1:147-1640(-)
MLSEAASIAVTDFGAFAVPRACLSTSSCKVSTTGAFEAPPSAALWGTACASCGLLYAAAGRVGAGSMRRSRQTRVRGSPVLQELTVPVALKRLFQQAVSDAAEATGASSAVGVSKAEIVALMQSLDVECEGGDEEACELSAFMHATDPSTTEERQELEFMPGQQVVLLGPPAMTGKNGIILGPAVGESFAVRLESGSVFHIVRENIQHAAEEAPKGTAKPSLRARTAMRAEPALEVTASGAAENSEFRPGQQIVVVGPPAMAGKEGSIVGPGLGDAFEVRFESGSIFNIAAGNLRSADAAPERTQPASVAPVNEGVALAEAGEDVVPAPSASSPSSASSKQAVAAPKETENEELEFRPGQRILVIGPPAMAGKKGTVKCPASGGTFEVSFETGSVFKLARENIQDEAAPALPVRTQRFTSQAVAREEGPQEDFSVGQDEDFSVGQEVAVAGNHVRPEMRGTIVSFPPGDPDAVAVRFQSGSIFYIAKGQVRCIPGTG